MMIPLHWYCFSFAYFEKNGEGFASSYSGFSQPHLFNRETIQNEKKQAAPNIPTPCMVLISITYLGYMTEDQFNSTNIPADSQ
jgi:hypothetical protein